MSEREDLHNEERLEIFMSFLRTRSRESLWSGGVCLWNRKENFLKGEEPESLWLEETDYGSKVTEENSETVDIFGPGMENLFDTGKIVIDAILAGEL